MGSVSGRRCVYRKVSVNDGLTAVAAAWLALSLAGCSETFPGLGIGPSVNTASISPAATAVTDGFVPGVPKGFQCPLVPNGFDPVGSIYRLDRDGTYFRVRDFTADPAIAGLGPFKRDVPISNYKLSDTQQASVGMSLDFLKASTASAAADYKKAMTVEVTVEDIVAEVIDDHVAGKIVDLFKASMEPKAGNRYFLVRETVRAGAVSYMLKQTDLGQLGGKAEVAKLAQGQANVTVRDNGGQFEIKQTFKPDRMTVCIKSAEIAIEGARAHPTVALRSVDDTPVPQIRRIGGERP